jgi:signal transduction histidine kinase
VDATGDRDGIVVIVSDDGPGIPADELRALYGSSESPLHHGSGLGLWVVKWITESYGGEVRIEEEATAGSEVTLSLPAAPRVKRLISAR